MRRRPVVLLAALAFAGCGGDEGQRDQNAENGAGPPRSAADTLRAAQEAIRAVDSYHVAGTQTDADGKTTLVGDVSGQDMRLRATQANGAAIEVVATGGDVYLKGNEAFWKETAEANAAVLELVAGKWVTTPDDASTRDLADDLLPETVATCIGDRLGTLELEGGDAEVDGRDALVVADAGDKPGTAPGKLYVSADEPHLPLRVTQTGERREGGPPPAPACRDDDDEDDEDTTIASDLRLSAFDVRVEIEAPQDPLDLEELVQDQQDQSTV